MPEPYPASSMRDEGEHSTLDSLKFLAFGKHKKHGFMYLQLVNAGYVNMTLSLVCNVKSLDSQILDKTLFIATDPIAANELKSHVPHIFLYRREGNCDLAYGQAVYFEFMLFRARIIEDLRSRGVNVWLVESDAVWLEDPTNYIKSFHGMDVVAGQDGVLSESIPEGGFLFLNSTLATKRMWNSLRHQHQDTLRANLGLENLGDSGSEMLMLPNHLKAVNWTFSPKERFVSGLWYSNEEMRKRSHPVVIQNNWIIGNAEKEKRAKMWGHWFLQDGSVECI